VLASVFVTRAVLGPLFSVVFFNVSWVVTCSTREFTGSGNRAFPKLFGVVAQHFPLLLPQLIFQHRDMPTSVVLDSYRVSESVFGVVM